MADVCGIVGSGLPNPGDPSNNSVLSAVPAFGGIDVIWTYPTTRPEAVAHTILYRSNNSLFTNANQHAIVAGDRFYDKTPLGQTSNTLYFYWIKFQSVTGNIGELIGPASATARPTIEQTIEGLTSRIDSSLLAQTLKTDIDKIGLLGTSISDEIKNRMAGDTAMTSMLQGVQRSTNNALTFIGQETTNRVNADLATITSLNLQGVGFNNSFAGIADELELKATAESALAKQFKTIEASVNGVKGTAQIGLIAEVDAAKETINTMYTVKLSTDNGKTGEKLIGGFGISNDGTEVLSVFDVDTFAVGRTKNGKRPFLVDGTTGEVFIDQGVINNLTFTKLRSEDGSVMAGLNPATGKYRLKSDYLEVNQITGGSFTNFDWPAAGTKGFYLGPDGLRMGNQNALPGQDSAYVQITDAGDFYAPGFNIIKGKMTIDQLDVVKTLNIGNNAVTVSVGSSSEAGGIQADNWSSVAAYLTAIHPGRIIVIATVNVPNAGCTQELWISKNGGSPTRVAYESLGNGSTSSFVYATDVSAGPIAAMVRNNDYTVRNLGVSILLTYK